MRPQGSFFSGELLPRGVTPELTRKVAQQVPQEELQATPQPPHFITQPRACPGFWVALSLSHLHLVARPSHLGRTLSPFLLSSPPSSGKHASLDILGCAFGAQDWVASVQSQEPQAQWSVGTWEWLAHGGDLVCLCLPCRVSE